MTAVNRRARMHADRNGDPMEALVNLFDLAIVLAVAFLLAALTSAGGATRTVLQDKLTPSGATVQVDPSAKPQLLTPTDQQVTGQGTLLGGVYRLGDGRLVYVPGK